jgi:hypothetical protein
MGFCRILGTPIPEMAVATITRKPLEHLAGGRPRVRLAIGKPADTVRLERALIRT